MHDTNCNPKQICMHKLISTQPTTTAIFVQKKHVQL